MADSAASPNSRPRRSGSTKQREATVSTETENKLARAARSAQRLAQLSDVPRDESTLDLFPDDPTRATLEAMAIDIRQGTLTGFELPAEVLAAVGITDGVDMASSVAAGAGQDTKSARRVTRAAKADETASASMQASVLDERVEPGLVQVAGQAGDGAQSSTTDVPVQGDGAGLKTKAPDVERDAAAAAAGNDAAATARASSVLPAAPSASSSALRDVAAARAGETAAAADGQQTPAAQCVATTFAKAATASREGAASGDATPEAADVAASASAPASVSAANAPQSRAWTGGSAVPKSAQGASGFAAPAGSGVSSARGASAESFSSSAAASASAAAASPFVAPPAPATTRAAPELDRARATAFADTVDALYGVIADQRRAATDHSRRMKWMLSIVVAALLATVAIGITQTMLLMRLTRDTTAAQQRIEQMMLNQQVTLTTLLDTDSSTVSTPAVTPPPAAPAAAAPAPRQNPPAQATRHAAKNPHTAHSKTKPSTTH